MKRLWAAFALLVLTLALSIFGVLHTQTVTMQTAATVREAKEAQRKGEQGAAIALSEKAVEDWHEAHRVLCLYMIHDRLEAIDQTLAALPELGRDNESQAFLSECDRGLTQIGYLNESEIPNLDNIF